MAGGTQTGAASIEELTLESRNLRLIGANNINGRGKLGEGIAIQRLGNRKSPQRQEHRKALGQHPARHGARQSRGHGQGQPRSRATNCSRESR